MDTRQLIEALAADNAQKQTPLGTSWRLALAAGVVVACIAFFAMIGPRADIGQAAHTARFLFKFVVTLVLAGSAFATLVALSRPEGGGGKALLLAPLLLAAAVFLEMILVPQADWESRMIGRNSMVCLTFIPLIGAGPLAIFLAVLKHGAPARPSVAGAAAGLLAGGLAATFYAAHCTDDSPLFVMLWYTLAVGILAAAGALAGRFVARW